LENLEEGGFGAVSIRPVARRIGVRMNTVLWHAKSKARLEELMAHAIVAAVPLNDLPENWRGRATELARRYPRALLAYPSAISQSPPGPPCSVFSVFSLKTPATSD
jgi:TetR/AcrR family tetracycline transcriptional repressor